MSPCNFRAFCSVGFYASLLLFRVNTLFDSNVYSSSSCHRRSHVPSRPWAPPGFAGVLHLPYALPFMMCRHQTPPFIHKQVMVNQRQFPLFLMVDISTWKYTVGGVLLLFWIFCSMCHDQILVFTGCLLKQLWLKKPDTVFKSLWKGHNTIVQPVVSTSPDLVEPSQLLTTILPTSLVVGRIKAFFLVGGNKPRRYKASPEITVEMVGPRLARSI